MTDTPLRDLTGMEPSKRLIRLHNENRTHLGLIRHEPTEVELLAKGIISDFPKMFFSAIAIGLFVMAVEVLAPVFGQFS